MRQIIEQFVFQALVNSSKEEFGMMGDNPLTPENLKKRSTYQIIALIVSLIVSQFLLLFLGKWLWNEFLVPSVQSVNKLDSIWQIMGISVLLRLLIN